MKQREKRKKYLKIRYIPAGKCRTKKINESITMTKFSETEGN